MRWLLLTVLVAGAAVLARAATAPAPPAEPTVNAAFRTLPGTAPATLWAVGDAEPTEGGRAVARMVRAADPDRLLYLGDVYERGTRAEFRTRYEPLYGPLARRTAPTPGNHEWPNHPTGYDAYWAAKTGAPTPPWYAFRVGGWTILSLNTEAPHGERSAQLRWLRARMRGARGTCRLAIWHRPLMSAGEHDDNPDVAPLWRAVRGHVRVVLNGHDHDMQRLRRRDGITQHVSGAGGRDPRPVDEDDPRLAFAADGEYGAMRIDLRPGRADIAHVRADGRVLDRSTATCRQR